MTATYIFLGASPYEPQMGTSTVRFDQLVNTTANFTTSTQKRWAIEGLSGGSFSLTFANPRIAYKNDQLFISYERTDARQSTTVKSIYLGILPDFVVPTVSTVSKVELLSTNGTEALNTHPVVVASEPSSVTVAWQHFNSEVSSSQLTSHIISCSPGMQTSGSFTGDFWRVTDEPAPSTYGSLTYRAPSLTQHPLHIYENSQPLSRDPLPDVLYFWYDQAEDNEPAVAYRLGGIAPTANDRAGAPMGNSERVAFEQPTRVTLAPNPATPSSRVGFDLKADEHVVSLTIVSLATGQIVATTKAEQLGSSARLAQLLPENVQSGLYAARLTTTRGTTTTKFVFGR